MLWFALKKYLWHPDYRELTSKPTRFTVVICAQKVSLTSWLQVVHPYNAFSVGCDLRSKSIFDILITGHVPGLSFDGMLWFALKKYLWHPDYRSPNYRTFTTVVVICAQKVSLTSWLQENDLSKRLTVSCDLRSKSIFDILITGLFAQY